VHELSLAEELVAECCRLAGGRRALSVRVGCPPTVDRAELEEGFYSLVPGSALEGANLEVQEAPCELSCPCGFVGQVGPEQLAGHFAICPQCAQARPVPGGVELLALRLEAQRST